MKIAAIVGPTGVGKTEISIYTAKALNAEIISCDSMQVYKGMDIGTAKITKDEIIISVKSPNWLKQYGHEGSKHSLIVDAANNLFGCEVNKIIVRYPESGDDEIRAEQSSSDDEKPAPAPKKPLIVEKPEVSNNEVKEIEK